MSSRAGSALRGSCTPVVTPFADGEVDEEAFERLVDRQAAAGSHGVVVTGTTGEPTSLSLRERGELYRRAVATLAGRLPVIAATGTPNLADTLELTRAAERAGVDAVLVVAPAFVKPSQQGLARYFTTVARSTELPVLIYNIPGRAAVAVAPETVARVAGDCPNLVGLKHASPDLDVVTEVLVRLGDEFRVFCGVESLSYPMLALGAAGLMSAVGNLLPEPVAALCDAVDGGDHARALELHRKLFSLNQAIFYDTNPVPLKHMLSRVGIAAAEVRPPLAPLDKATRRSVDTVLADALTDDALAAAVPVPHPAS